MLAELLLAVTAEAVTADGLMAQVLARAQGTAKLRYERGLTGTKHEQVHDTEDKDEPAKLTTDKEFRLAMAADGLRHQLVMLNGAPVGGQPMESPEIDPTVILVTLHSRYDFRMASPEPVDGYYSIAFSPKKTGVPAPKNDKEMVINHLSGVIYIDANRLFVRRFQAWLEKSFSVKGIGRVHEASALLDQELVDDLPVPRRSVFSVRYSALFWTTDTRTTVTYEYDLQPVIQTPLP